MMNDTFDDFTFSDLQSNISVLRITSPLNSTKTTNEKENTIKSENETNSFLSAIKNDISFDDSFFINSPKFTQLETNKEESQKDTNVEIIENQEKQIHENNDLFDISNEAVTNTHLSTPINVQLCNTPELNNSLHGRESDKSNIIENENAYKLSSWGLPDSILEKYESRNITSMFPWQVECLNNVQVLKNNKNLVYSAPTSAGKTLIAEILTIKTVLERDKKVIIILPFVSVVREKMFYFQDILSSSGVRVEGFMGSYNPPGGFQSVQVAICTIEKANNLINKLLQEGKLSEIGAVVIDEMHLLGDPSRGYLLELLLTKLRYMSLKQDDVRIQIIGMSATLPNLEMLAKWLDAELYITSFRPIPLYEQAHVCGDIYDNQLKLVRQLKPLPELDTDTDNILQLCLETIRDCCSVLIFCPTKNWCENLAQQIATAFWKLGNSKNGLSQELRKQLKPDLIIELLEQLKFCPVGLDDVLRKTVSFGVAFHHAGLTLDERDIIEGAFRNGAIRVLVATSTLSSGVNLPARRVIIRTPLFHGKPLDALTYRQMIGRAGRMGKDTAGESFLVCQKNDYKIAKSLMNEQLQPIESCLEGEGKLKRAILEIIASGVASSPEDVELFTRCTLLAQNENFEDPIEEAVKFLVTNEFIRLQKQDDGSSKYVATSLGKACLSSSIPPEDGLALFTELEKARQCFVLETELHLIYLVTPYSACHQWGNMDWMFYLNLWEKLPASMKKVGELVGVREGYIVSATRGKLQTNTSKLYHKLLVHKRFFVALALQDLVNEKSLSEVCSKFNCNRGMLQSLQLSASTFAGMVTSFSRQLGWSSVEILISQFQDRLHFGVSRDLLDLMRLPVLNGKSARALFDGGLETLIQLANSDVITIENILHKVMPFESGKKREGETEFELKERNKMRNIWITGKEGLTEREAAELLLYSARNYLKIELGLKEAKWDKSQTELSDTSKETSLEHDSNDSGVKNSTNASSVDLNCEIEQQENLDFNTSDNIFSPLKESSNSHHISDGSLFEESLTNETNLKLDANMMKDEFITNYCSKNTSSGSLNSSGDFISTSQDENYASFNIQTPGSSRKRSRRSNDNDLFLLYQSPIKKTKVTKEVNKAILSNITQNLHNVEKCDLDINEIEIVDVCRYEQLFSSFCNEVKHEKFISLSVACSEIEEKKATIGLNAKSSIETNTPVKFSYKNRRVEGFSISWGGNTVYYLNLAKMENCIDIVKHLTNKKELTINMFDCKEQIKILKNCCNIEFFSKVEDPKIGDWLLQPEGKEKNFQAMVLTYCPKILNVSRLCGTTRASGSPSLDIHNDVKPKIKSSIESLVTWYITKSVKDALYHQNKHLLDVYAVEMSCLKSLAKMETIGLGAEKEVFYRLVETINKEKTTIERKTHSLAGRRFSFTSSKDVAKILGLFKGRKVSTKKQILEKNENPISDLVLNWRKLNSIITKTIQPLIRSVENGRIHGCCVMHTATGRITMHEPNLQNVAKNFEITNMVTGSKTDIRCRDAFVPKDGCVFVSADYCQLELRLLAHLSRDELLRGIMRGKGDVFKSVAAKWNNIEEKEVTDDMRQHAKQICYGIIYGMGSKSLSEQLSIDEQKAATFMETFRKAYPGVKNYIKDVVNRCRENGFVETIAGRRRYLPHINHTNPTIRSKYYMALPSVFNNRWQYVTVVKGFRGRSGSNNYGALMSPNKGETGLCLLFDLLRSLPFTFVLSTITQNILCLTFLIGQAERQAVNTTIQGSAADIVKNTMVELEKKIFAVEHQQPNLVLHLHDELLYEVPRSNLRCFATFLKKVMEESVKLSIPFPVKVKSGPSWGRLTEYHV